MRISIQTLGTLGDVMPFLALARTLGERGHTVTVLAPRDHTAVIRAHGVTAAPSPDFSVAEWMDLSETRGTLRGPVSFLRDWPVMIRPHIDDVLARSLDAAREADLVLANPIAMPARIAAEHYRLPFMLMALQPVLTPSGALPCAMIARRDMGRWFNRASYLAVTASLTGLGAALERERRRLVPQPRPGLADLSRHLGEPLPRLTALPALFDIGQPTGWGAASRLVDYPPLHARDTALPDDITRFLDAGPPPVYLGLGSMPVKAGDRRLSLWLDRLEAAGQRALVSTGLAQRPAGPMGRHHVCGSVPHDRLFAHCQAVIHHGGAGTLDTAARAGCPQIVLPHVLDQFWNATRLAKAGVAPDLPRQTRYAAEIDRLLAFALAPDTRDTARQWRDRLAAREAQRPAVALIADLVEAHAGRWSASAR